MFRRLKEPNSRMMRVYTRSCDIIAWGKLTFNFSGGEKFRFTPRSRKRSKHILDGVPIIVIKSESAQVWKVHFSCQWVGYHRFNVRLLTALPEQNLLKFQNCQILFFSRQFGLSGYSRCHCNSKPVSRLRFNTSTDGWYCYCFRISSGQLSLLRLIDKIFNVSFKKNRECRFSSNRRLTSMSTFDRARYPNLLPPMFARGASILHMSWSA